MENRDREVIRRDMIAVIIREHAMYTTMPNRSRGLVRVHDRSSAGQ